MASRASAAKRALVVGACGKMGERVRAALRDHPEMTLGAALEAPGHPEIGATLEGVTVTDDAKAALADSDVVIDFSVPAATLSHIHAAADAGVAYVTGTTGLDDAAKAVIAECAERIPVIQAANFSVAVNVLGWLTREAAGKLGPDYDAEIFELHHNQKRDAPSGTALFLGEQLADGRGQQLAAQQVLERAGEVGARRDGEIGIQTLRGGDNAGEHTVMFIGHGERIELVHRSHSRDHFARGAVRAAAWLVGKPARLYPIAEMLGLRD